MQDPKDKKIISRYFTIIILMVMVGLAILLKAMLVMVFERGYWREVSNTLVVDSVSVPARRGNILSDEGLLMASSVPQYTLLMDFMVSEKDPKIRKKLQHERDSLLKVHETEICEGLHRILPDQSTEEFRRRFREGRKKESRYYKIYPRRVSYAQYKEIKQLPVLCLRSNVGGFRPESNTERIKIYGSLARRTLGDMYPKVDSAKTASSWPTMTICAVSLVGDIARRWLARTRLLWTNLLLMAMMCRPLSMSRYRILPRRPCSIC